MMQKYLQLPNGNKLEIYDHIINKNTCLFKFINESLDTIKSFFGSDIITYVNILDENLKITHSYDIEARRKECICEDTVIQEKTYRVVKDAWEETIPAVIDETSNNVIQEESSLFHEAEYEEIIKEIPVEMITVIMGKPTINEEVNSIKQAVGIVNPNIMTLDEFKAYYAGQSKAALEKYLSENPLVSSCHGGKAGIYCITEAKQNLMTGNYLTYMIKKAEAPDTILFWNESGEPCEEWTEQEYLQLIMEIEAVVKPLVSHQQYLEKSIYNAADIMSIKNISFDYFAADIRNPENKE